MSTTRIVSITLNDFKNVKKGSIIMPRYIKGGEKNRDILGIYGQNGSGKTAIIDALFILQKIMSGFPLPERSRNYINIESSSFSLSLTLDISPFFYTYSVTISKDNGKAYISKETLFMKEQGKRETILASYSREDRKISPSSALKKICADDKEKELDLLVSSRLMEKNNESFLFGNDTAFSLLSSSGYVELKKALTDIKDYADSNLIVLSAKESGLSSDYHMMLTYQKKENGEIKKGTMSIDLNKPALLSKDERRTLGRIIAEMNRVLSAVVPHLVLSVYDAGKELTEEGESACRVELVSLKNGKAIPLRYESEGIIKIISLVNLLLFVYNNPSVCLVIDEFDASIFEYLLGEIVLIFSKNALGQLIFTSHNLRILEMIDKDNIIFSTSNAENRYIRMTGSRRANLRDRYISSILLGGSKENMYEETDTYEIGKALKDAWVKYDEEEETDTLHS